MIKSNELCHIALQAHLMGPTKIINMLMDGSTGMSPNVYDMNSYAFQIKSTQNEWLN